MTLDPSFSTASVDPAHWGVQPKTAASTPSKVPFGHRIPAALAADANDKIKAISAATGCSLQEVFAVGLMALVANPDAWEAATRKVYLPAQETDGAGR